MQNGGRSDCRRHPNSGGSVSSPVSLGNDRRLARFVSQRISEYPNIPNSRCRRGMLPCMQWIGKGSHVQGFAASAPHRRSPKPGKETAAREFSTPALYSNRRMGAWATRRPADRRSSRAPFSSRGSDRPHAARGDHRAGAGCSRRSDTQQFQDWSGLQCEGLGALCGGSTAGCSQATVRSP